MKADEHAFATLSETARQIRAGRLSPVDVVELMLERIGRLNDHFAWYYTVFDEQARADARRLADEAMRGHFRSPLHGIPVCVKDIVEAGRTTCGSLSLSDYEAQSDAEVVRRLRQAGCVILGKTATYEFAAGAPWWGSRFGPTRNPWLPERETGGSSSGTAGAVAAGLAFGGIGTDTGASIRFPSVSCLLVGLKPTYGRVSRQGVFPLSWSCDHVGPITRTVADAALLLQQCAGYDKGDPASANVSVPDFGAKLGTPIRGMRLGVPRRLLENTCDERVLAKFEAALEVLRGLGASIVDVPGPSLEQLVAVFWTICCSEAAAAQINNVKRRGRDFTPRYRQQVLLGILMDGPQYVLANRVRAHMRDELTRVLRDEAELLVLPTLGFPGAPPIPNEPPPLRSLGLGNPRFTALFNVTGLPAVQVPCGFDSDGIPAGFQVAGKPFDEATILQVAAAYEQATPWHEMHPAITAPAEASGQLSNRSSHG